MYPYKLDAKDRATRDEGENRNQTGAGLSFPTVLSFIRIVNLAMSASVHFIGGIAS